MQGLASYIDGRFNGFTSAPVLPQYSSVPFIPVASLGPISQTSNAHPEGRYIGVGYSAGGLITRSIVNLHGVVVPPARGFVEGFVTLGTPHTGASITHRWEWLLFKDAVAKSRIERGSLSLIAYGSLVFDLAISTLLTVVGEAVRANTPFVQDLKPGSSWLSVANGSSWQAIENSLVRGKTVVYGEVVGRKRPAHNSSTPADINPDQNAYQLKINEARANAHYYDRKAEELNRGGWLRRAANWVPRTWNRMRAGDWSAAANGYEELNDAWEWATADRGPSDTFISVESQTGLPNRINARRIPFQMNHKNEHQTDGNPGGMYQGPPTVDDAIRFDLLVQ